ncbi:MAG: N-6 DNA methylase, partial [Pirellula sp.]
CAILFPHGVLFRDAEQEMRRKLIETDLIECVIGLGPNLFYNSPMEACIVICRTQKPKACRNRILFINAVNEVTRERAQSFLRDEHIQRIADAYHSYEDVPNLASVETLDSVRSHNCDLRLHYYVTPETGNQVLQSDNGSDLAQTIKAWQVSSDKLRQSMTALFATLKEAERGK